jgi:hypothetical protein
MYSSAGSKDTVDQIVGSKPARILDDSHVFDTACVMLYSYPDTARRKDLSEKRKLFSLF